MARPAPRLESLQNWFLAVASHPDGAAAGFKGDEARAILAEAPEDVLLPSKRLSIEERMDVYADMYFWRLIDVLRDDYDILDRILGHEGFYKLGKAYLQKHPSRSYTLSRLDESWLAFLEDEGLAGHPHRDFLLEMARLQSVIDEVFNADEAPPVSVDALLAIPQEAWASARFRFIPGFQLMRFRYATNPYFQACREDREGPVPTELEDSFLAVYRKEFVVWRLDLDLTRFTLLRALSDGATLTEALERCADAPGVDFETLVGSLTAWFRDWTADGFFRAVEVA